MRLTEALRRRISSDASGTDEIVGLDALRNGDQAITLCHPEWRGIRQATEAQGLPTVLARELRDSAGAILDRVSEVGTRTVIVNGCPPGTAEFAAAATARGVVVRVLMHSSMAQHGAEYPEGAVITQLLDLSSRGLIDVLAFTKAGQAEAFRAMGFRVVHVPARCRPEPEAPRHGLGDGRHVGIFAEAAWRKNVTTQLGAVAILGATAHVTELPDVGYLAGQPFVRVHGLLDRAAFRSLIASVDITMAVSLFESFPVTVQESYWLGVPCLMSRTSALFRDDGELWALTTVDEHDNPTAVARAARRLLEFPDRAGLVGAARDWLRSWDASAALAWQRFVDPQPYPS